MEEDCGKMGDVLMYYENARNLPENKYGKYRKQFNINRVFKNRVGKGFNSCRVSDFICIFAILKEVFCKDTNLLRKGKARACESLGFVVNKNNFFSSVSGKRRKNEKGAP